MWVFPASSFDVDQNMPLRISCLLFFFFFLKQHAYVETLVPLNTIQKSGERKRKNTENYTVVVRMAYN